MAGTRQIRFRLWVDWTFSGSYTDESQYMIDASGDMSISPPSSGMTSGQGIVSQMRITMRNASGRFSPLRTDGALYSAIRDGRGYHAPCYLEVSVNGGSSYSRVFTGVLKLPQESTLTSSEGPTVTFDARSMEEKYLQRRISLTQGQLAAIYDGGLTEKDIIVTFLNAAGVAGGDMTLDPGLFVVPWAWLDDESAIEECWSIAAACGGRFYADPDGEFLYENMEHWQTATRSTSVQLALGRNDFDSFRIHLGDDDLYNVVTVEASPRVIGGVDIIWEPDSTPVIPPGTSTTIVARYDAPAYAIAGLQFSAADQGGGDRTSSVTITPTYYAQRADLAVVNNAAYQIILFPLRILGVPVIGGPELESRSVSVANAAYWTGRGDRTLSIRGNPYIQTSSHAGVLSQFLLDRCEYPRLIAQVGLPGVPSLRLGDRVQITDAPTLSSTFTGYISTIRWTLGGAFRQELELIHASQMFAYDGNYFVLNTHNFASGRRAFY